MKFYSRSTALSLNQSPKTYARIAGLLYLMIAALGIFSIVYLPSLIVVEGNAAATLKNVAAYQTMMKLGIVADTALIMFELILSVMLYRLLRPISKTMASVALFARFAMILIMALNLINYILPLFFLNEPALLNSFDAPQVRQITLFLFDLHQLMIYLWGLFFGLHLLALGYLISLSGYFPRLPGILMMAGSLGYCLESLLELTFSENPILGTASGIALGLSVLGELGFAFWLLFRGLRTDIWEKVRLIRSRN